MANINIYGTLYNNTTDPKIAFAAQIYDEDFENESGGTGEYQSVINQKFADEIAAMSGNSDVSDKVDQIESDVADINNSITAINQSISSLPNDIVTSVGGTSSSATEVTVNVQKATKSGSAYGSASPSNFVIRAATASMAGVMTAADKTALDNAVTAITDIQGDITEIQGDITGIQSSITEIKEDITNIGDNIQSATSKSFGTVKLGSDEVLTGSSRTYPIQRNADGQLMVSVPWTGGTVGTDVNVTQEAAITTDGDYNVIVGHSSNTSQETDTVNKAGGLTYNPSTKKLTTTTFVGNLEGTASHATADGDGNVFSETYAKTSAITPDDHTVIQNAASAMSGAFNVLLAGTSANTEAETSAVNKAEGLTYDPSTTTLLVGTAVTLAQDGVKAAGFSVPDSASMGADGISLNDHGGHTVAIRVNGVQIPQAVDISGNGNAVTDVSFSNGRLTFAKGTISGGQGADGNSYPTSVDLTYSNGNVGVSLASTNGMAAISDTVTIDDTLRLDYTLKSNEKTARLQFDFGYDDSASKEQYSFKVNSDGITLADNVSSATLVIPFGQSGTLVVDTALSKEEIEEICV